MTKEPLHDEWFNGASESIAPEEWPSMPISSRRAGDPAWSTITGAMAGVLGATVVFIFMMGLDARAQPLIFASAVSAGAALGGLFGRVTRRLVRVWPRIALGAILAAAVWLGLYALVLARFAPQIAHSMRFASSMIDALVFGACVGALPPVRVRYEHGRRA